METNLLSRQMMMTVDGVPVETSEDPRGATIRFSDQLYGTFDKRQAALWMHWRPQPRACFNPGLLKDMQRFGSWIRQNSGAFHFASDEKVPVRFIVVMSDVPNVFNLGGDLDRFQSLIEARDHEGLLAYGTACIDVLYSNYSAYDLPLSTISLVQGDALGGGFEAALSSDVIVAERQARFGFPEILFNLFPGMGAYSFIRRKVTLQRTATELISGGQVFSAQAMLDLELIDRLTDDGSGEKEVTAMMRQSGPTQELMFKVRRRASGLDRSELRDIVELWADTAMRISERDLRLMQVLVKRQDQLSKRLNPKPDEPSGN